MLDRFLHMKPVKDVDDDELESFLDAIENCAGAVWYCFFRFENDAMNF